MTETGQKVRVKVAIHGQDYTVIGDKTTSQIEKVALEVDQLMKKINQANPHMPALKVAVLAALNLADELLKTKEDYQWLLQLIEDEKNKSQEQPGE